MTLVLLEKGLLLEGSNPKIEDKHIPSILILGVPCFCLCDSQFSQDHVDSRIDLILYRQ